MVGLVKTLVRGRQANMRSLRTWGLGLAFLQAGACGLTSSDRDAVDPGATGGQDGGAPGSDGGAPTTGGNIGSGGSAAEGGTDGVGGLRPSSCDGSLGEPDFSPVPGEEGCWSSTSEGWQRIACNCELWVENRGAESLNLELTFTVSPGDTVPNFENMPGMSVVFDDARGVFFDTWQEQDGYGTEFLVMREGSVTTLQLGTTTLTLASGSFPACESRTALASISGTFDEKLEMTAVLRDSEGTVQFSDEGECFNPQHP